VKKGTPVHRAYAVQDVLPPFLPILIQYTIEKGYISFQQIGTSKCNFIELRLHTLEFLEFSKYQRDSWVYFPIIPCGLHVDARGFVGCWIDESLALARYIRFRKASTLNLSYKLLCHLNMSCPICCLILQLNYDVDFIFMPVDLLVPKNIKSNKSLY
jgi:hypothetical protein